jgi:hypothetical protein
MDKIAAEPGFVDGPIGRRFFTVVFQEVDGRIHTPGVVLDPTGFKWEILSKVSVSSKFESYRLEARQIAQGAISRSNEDCKRDFERAVNKVGDESTQLLVGRHFHRGNWYQVGYRFAVEGGLASWSGIVGLEDDYLTLQGLVDVTNLSESAVKIAVENACLREVSHL